jgi:hypothetical protein
MISIERTAENIEIDRLFHFMGAAKSEKSQKLWESRWREAIKKRDLDNAAERSKTEKKSRL